MDTTFQNGYVWGSARFKADQIEVGYKVFNDIMQLNPFSPSMSIMSFLALQKKAYENVSTIKAPNPDEQLANMQSDEAKEVLNSMNKIAGIQFLQNFYDMYMSPITKCDITWRLGVVTGVKDNVDSNGDVVRNEQVDEYGRLPTATNFKQMFYTQFYSPWSNQPIVSYIPYVNLFFPPYKTQTTGFTNEAGETLSLEEYVKLSLATIRDGGSTSTLKDKDGNILYDSDGKPMTETKTVSFDMSQLLSTRGNFTYRSPAFKAVNDNITFLQWIFEQTSGVVSTYLTEWDISLYIQEGLISNSYGKLPEYISLVHRLKNDNPQGYTDYKANSYGIVNAATSKLFGTNVEIWDPSSFPLSSFWCNYPSWEKHVASYSLIFRSLEGETIRFPKFYWTAKTSTIPNGYNQYVNFYDKLRKWDEENAALSGWYNWIDMKTYQALYSTDEDKLSDIDVNLMSTAAGYNKKSDIIDQMLLTSFGIDLSCGEIGLDSNVINNLNDLNYNSGNYSSNAVYNGSSGDGSLKICGVKIGGSLLSKITKVVGIFTGAGKKKSAGQKQVDAARSSGRSDGISNTAGGYGGGSGNSRPGTSIGSGGGLAGHNNLASALGMDEDVADFANATGVPQTNPPLYGGPHGVHSSPNSVQAYLQNDNGFLRDLPRMDPSYNYKNYHNETKKNYFTGNEKYFTRTTIMGGNPDIYEHSFSEGKMRLKNGITDYRWAYATCRTTVTNWFIGQAGNYYTWRGRCYRYPIWPTYINGHYINWYSYNYGNSWRAWASYWTGPYVWWTLTTRNKSTINSVSGFGTSLLEGGQYYGSYINNSSRYWYKNGLWYISTLSPYRQGSYYYYAYVPYKKYFLHSEPLVHWTVTKIRTCSYQITHSWGSGWSGWWRRFWGGWFGYFTTITVTACNYQDKWRLRFPDYGLSYYKSVYNNSPNGKSGWRYFTRTWMEDTVRRNMVDIGKGVGACASMIFLQSGSYSDRVNNGPANIFRAPVRHEQVRYVYYTRCKHSRRCRKKYYHYIPHIGYENVISVDLNRCDLFYSETNRDVNSNYYMDKYPWKTKPTSATSLTGPHNFVTTNGRFACSYTLGENVWVSYTGFEGYGLMGCIQGLDGNFVDNPPFENFSSWLKVSDGLKYQRAFVDIPYRYQRISYFNNAMIWWNGMQCWAEGGFPVFYNNVMDAGLRKSLARIFNRGTLYKNDQWPYQKGAYSNFGHYFNVSVADSVRVLYSEVLWQKTFLECERELLTGTMPNTYTKMVDFNAINKILVGDKTVGEKGVISQRTYTLSDPEDPQVNIGEERPYFSHEIYGYNPWIAEIRKWVSDDPAVNTSMQSKLRDKFDNRISLYEEAIAVLKPLAHKNAMTLSYNELGLVADILSELDDELSKNSEIEHFMMGYLNVLYEYRRFFINKRFNKQDGSMWLCRALESAIPMVFQNGLQTGIGDVEALSGRKQYDVAFYQVQNSTTDKVTAIQNGIKLDDDRISIVYVKMDYVSESTYKSAMLDYAKGISVEPTVVKVLPYTQIDYKMFKEAYNDDKIRKTVMRNGNPMVSGGNIGSSTAKYFQYDYTLDSKGNAVYKYKYARKPQNGLYRLESKEFLNNENNIIFNNLISQTPGFEAKMKYVDERIDTAVWYISWGEPNTPDGILPTKDENGIALNVSNKVYKENGVSAEYKYGTPGLYDLVDGIDVSKITDTLNSGLTDPISILCSSKKTSNYWTVKLSCALPRQIGFLNEVKLVAYKEKDEEQEGTVETALSGIMSYALYPIMENQVNQIPNMSDALNTLTNSMAAVTSNPDYSKV